MNKRLLINPIFSLFCLTVASTATAQVRDVTTWKGSALVTYSVMRYNPVWQVQNGTEPQKASPDRPPFFQDLKLGQVEPLMGLLNTGVESNKGYGSVREATDALAKNKIELYAQIRKGNHHIFIAHLNGSSVRSVIPFIEENGKWRLDVDFSATPLYDLLRDPKFDPFSGRFIGYPHLNVGFEGLDGGSLADHSGNRQRSKVRNISFSEGRFGKAMRLNSASQADIEVKRSGNLKSEDLTLGLWLKLDAKSIGKVLNAVDPSGTRTIKVTKTGADKCQIQLAGSKGSVVGEVIIPTDKWFELEVRLSRGEFIVFVDQLRATGSRADIGLNSSIHNVTIGGNGAATGLIDELHIGF